MLDRRDTLAAVTGLRIGHAGDPAVGSGVTTVVFDEPVVASVAVGGGAPGLRDTALLEPGMSVERVDALVLAGGSAFGLDAPGGVAAALRQRGRGLAVRGARVPIVPGAILFDLLNGGDKDWGATPLYWHLGRAAALDALEGDGGAAQGSVGAGLGATTATYKGGLGQADAISPDGFTVAAVVAVNALGSATVGDGPQFWAAPWERDGEFGGRGWPQLLPPDAAAAVRMKGDGAPATTIGIVATDAALTRAECKRLAVMAGDGLARALRPVHAAMDGDTIFAAATARAGRTPDARALAVLGTLAADCVARAVARGVYEATALPFAGAQAAWRDRWG